MATKKKKKNQGGNFIAQATKNEGGLHRSLGVSTSKKIPASKIEAATRSKDPVIRKQAILAQTLAKLRNRR